MCWHFFVCVSHPNRHGQTLVPLWICILLQNLSADLKKKEKAIHLKWLGSVFNVGVEIMFG